MFALTTLLPNIMLEVLASAVRQENIKGVRIGKTEIKPSLFIEDMTVYIENPKESTKKFLELMNELC